MSQDLSFAQIAEKYLAAVLSSMDLDIEQSRHPQTLIRVEPDRAGSELAVAYHVGEIAVVRTDPSLADAVRELVSPGAALDADQFKQWATARSWRFIDGGDHHVIDRSGLVPRPLPSAATLRELDREDTEDRRLIAEFLAGNDPDDVDEAEFDMDDLDPLILALLAEGGEIGAMVSGRVWDADPTFDDIGILVDDRLRTEGWGSAAVTAFCVASFDRGRLPLYRCDWSRTASKALAMSLGFQQVGQVSAAGPASPD